jgi:hypothetical protein
LIFFRIPWLQSLFVVHFNLFILLLFLRLLLGLRGSDRSCDNLASHAGVECGTGFIGVPLVPRFVLSRFLQFREPFKEREQLLL